MTLLILLLGACYLLAGPFVVKRSLAATEKRRLTEHPEQPCMDADDWISAIINAVVALVFTPVLVPYRGLALVTRPAHKPVRDFFVPPVQKKHEQHVEVLDRQQDIILETAKEIAEVGKWEPDDDSKKAVLDQLYTVLHQQTEELAKMMSPQSMFDQKYMAVTRERLDQARRGFKELTEERKAVLKR